MRRFDSEGHAVSWLNQVMSESTNKHSDIRIAYHSDVEQVAKYFKRVEACPTKWRVDLDVFINGDSATIGCDVHDMNYRFEGRLRPQRPH